MSSCVGPTGNVKGSTQPLNFRLFTIVMQFRPFLSFPGFATVTEVRVKESPCNPVSPLLFFQHFSTKATPPHTTSFVVRTGDCFFSSGERDSVSTSLLSKVSRSRWTPALSHKCAFLFSMANFSKIVPIATASGTFSRAVTILSVTVSPSVSLGGFPKLLVSVVALVVALLLLLSTTVPLTAHDVTLTLVL